ncbi:MAG TPA: rhodanese-like domain-containing protein [Acidimicrobiia bacterium]|nr:rhodanese-like domain-containing protein [Acidimicrobiia bacterium]
MSTGNDIPTVDVAAALQRVGSGAVLLDVREPEEWHAGHAAEARWIAMGEIEARHTELSADTPIVVMCRSGNRSGMVTQALVGAGYDASNIAGGMQAWAAAGFAVVTDDGSMGTVA